MVALNDKYLNYIDGALLSRSGKTKFLKRLERKTKKRVIANAKSEVRTTQRKINESAGKMVNGVLEDDDFERRKELKVAKKIQTSSLRELVSKRVVVNQKQMASDLQSRWDRLVEYEKRRNERVDATPTENWKLRYIVLRKYLHPDEIIARKQFQGLIPWLDYLIKHFDVGFQILMLGTVLKYDYRWMDKDMTTGTFKTRRRNNREMQMGFPKFENNTPTALNKLAKLVSSVVAGEEVANVGAHMDSELKLEHPFRTAADAKNVRQMYSVILEELETTNIDPENIEQIVIVGWKPYSLKGLTDEEAKVVVEKIVADTKYSRGFCLKDEDTAKVKYLEKGDVYLYLVRKLVAKKDADGNIIKKEWLIVPEVGVYILPDKVDGTFFIDPTEVHGNGDNQGIETEYLDVAKKFVEEGGWTNTMQILCKFSDSVNLKKLEEVLASGDGKTLLPVQLKFLHQIHRGVSTFEVASASSVTIWGLFTNRFLRFMSGNGIGSNIEGRIKVQDVMAMFGLEETEICFPNKISKGDDLERQAKKPKVIFGNLILENSGDLDFEKLEEITGELVLGNGKLVGSFSENFGNLKKIRGIVLTEEDKYKIMNSVEAKFPDANDFRLVDVYGVL